MSGSVFKCGLLSKTTLPSESLTISPFRQRFGSVAIPVKTILSNFCVKFLFFVVGSSPAGTVGA